MPEWAEVLRDIQSGQCDMEMLRECPKTPCAVFLLAMYHCPDIREEARQELERRKPAQGWIDWMKREVRT